MRLTSRSRLSGSSSTTRRQHRKLYVEQLEDRQLLTVFLDPLSNRTIPVGRSLIVPLTAAESDNLPLTYTVTSSNPGVQVVVHNGNPFLNIAVENFGDMQFQLLEDVAPLTVTTISGLVNSGFYDGLTFHRVVPNFVIQGGDPNGDGTGGATGPGFPFADEIHLDQAIFSGDGQLAMANSGPNTNSSQFFVTIGPQRSLDGRHTIFGQLIRGFDVRDDIVAFVGDDRDPGSGLVHIPPGPITISTAEIVENTSDNVITLLAQPGFQGSSRITVRVDNGQGGIATRQFRVSVGTTTNQTYVDGLYRDMLGRASDPSGLDYFSDILDQDLVTREQVVLAMENSMEYVTLQVNNAYRELLHREPDPIGFRNSVLWLGVLHGSLESLRAVIASSPEYFQVRAGGSIPNLVTNFYVDLLGRPADPAGLEASANALAAGMDRHVFAIQLLRSPESHQKRVDALFQRFLHRSIETTESNVYLDAFRAGVYEELLMMVIAGSQERFDQG